VVWAPGDRWFAVEIDGGYSLDHFEELTHDDEVHRTLSSYVDIAVAYVRSDAAPVRSGRFRAPRVTVVTDTGVFELRMSVLAGFKAAITRAR
jgi:hypothetical protein